MLHKDFSDFIMEALIVQFNIFFWDYPRNINYVLLERCNCVESRTIEHVTVSKV